MERVGGGQVNQSITFASETIICDYLCMERIYVRLARRIGREGREGLTSISAMEEE